LLGFFSSEFEVFILVVPHHWVLVPDILRQHGLKGSFWPWRWRPRWCLKMLDITTQWHDATSQKNKALNVLTGFTRLTNTKFAGYCIKNLSLLIVNFDSFGII